ESSVHRGQRADRGVGAIARELAGARDSEPAGWKQQGADEADRHKVKPRSVKSRNGGRIGLGELDDRAPVDQWAGAEWEVAIVHSIQDVRRGADGYRPASSGPAGE